MPRGKRRGKEGREVKRSGEKRRGDGEEQRREEEVRREGGRRKKVDAVGFSLCFSPFIPSGAQTRTAH